MKRQQLKWGILLVAPAFLFLVVFKFAPIAMAIFASFCDWSTTRGFKEFVGLENYRFLFKDPVFATSLKTTIVFAITLTLIQIVLALILAFLLSKTTKVTTVARLIIFHPYAISLSIASLIWWIMYAEWGLVNSIVSFLGFRRQAWLTSSDLALWSLVLMLIWKGIGYWMMVLIAGINGIPYTIREAAIVDGATYWQRLIRIDLPLLKRPLAFAFVADTIINFLLFAPPYIMTAGGPQNRTLVLSLYAYRMAFVYNDLGYASAVSCILLCVVMVIVAMELRLMRSAVEY